MALEGARLERNVMGELNMYRQLGLKPNFTQIGRKYGLQLADGPLEGLAARAVIVVDEQGKIIYTQLVEDISHEPDYDAALKALGES